MVWEKNGTPDTISGGASTMSIPDLIAVNFNEFLTHQIQNGNVLNHRIDSISTGTYAERFSDNGAADSLNVSQTELETATSGTNDEFCNMYGINIGTEEKLFIASIVGNNAAGAANIPRRREFVGKQVGTSLQYTSIETTLTAANDSNLSALGDVIPPPPAVGGWVEVGRTTLGSEEDFITVSSLPDKRYYMTLNNIFATGNAAAEIRLNGDTGLNYPHRQSANGAADGTTAADNRGVEFTINLIGNQGFGVGYLANVATKEKLAINNYVAASVTGAGTAPNRQESVWKHVQTTNPIDEVQSANILTEPSGGFLTGSEEVVLAWDPTDTHTNNFWEELASVELVSANSNLSSGTITAKKYLWIQAFLKKTSASTEVTMQYNNDTGGNYARRRSVDGGADGTDTSATQIDLVGGVATPSFFNMFVINNSANEKLGICHIITQNTAGASTAPQRAENVNKWDNTAAQITEIDLNSIVSTFASGSIMRVWGSD